jgi:C-terminal processing protease CtpA/Prc
LPQKAGIGVQSVDPESVAADRVRRGDLIVAVDGESTARMSAEDAEALLSQPGDKAILLRRSDATPGHADHPFSVVVSAAEIAKTQSCAH